MEMLELFRRDRRSYLGGALKVVNEDSKVVPWGPMLSTQSLVHDIYEEELATGRPVRLVILKARRHRISTWAQGMAHHMLMFRRNANITVVADSDPLTKTLFAMQETFDQNLPAWMRPMKRRAAGRNLEYDNPDGGYRATNPGLGSSLMVYCAAGRTQKVSAAGQGSGGIGRGSRVDFVHATEVAFWPRGGEIAVALANSIPESPDVAFLIESTANGMSGFFWETWQKAKLGEGGYRAIFLPWFLHQLYDASHLRGYPAYVPTESDEAMFEDMLALALAGMDSAAHNRSERLRMDEDERKLVAAHPDHITWSRLLWRRWCIRYKCDNEVRNFRQEFPSDDLEAFTATGTCRFDNAKIERVFLPKCHPPMQGTISAEGYNVLEEAHAKPSTLRFETRLIPGVPILNILEGPRPDASYCIGVDVSKGIGRDRAVVSVMDRARARHVAYIADEWLGPVELAEYALLVAWYYGKAWILPENNAEAALTCNKLYESGYPNVYMAHRTRKGLSGYNEVGLRTDGSSREMYVQTFADAIKRDLFSSASEELWREAVTFVDDGKKSQHLKGQHDDLLMATILCVAGNPLIPETARLVISPDEDRLRRQWGQRGGDEAMRAPAGSIYEELKAERDALRRRLILS